MNCIDLNGEMVTPKTEAMAYTQTNNRIGTLEEKHENDMTNTRQRISETASEIGYRIDNIIAHNNDTEGNSELIDIRTGADGMAYESAGTAVRGQVQELSDHIAAFCSAPESIINFVTAEFYYRVTPVSVSNRTKHSFTITDTSSGTTNRFNGFILDNLVVGKTYRVEFEFNAQSTFPENLEYYISIVTNSDMSGTTLGNSIDVQKGSFTFTATNTAHSLRFSTTSGCTQTIGCKIFDNSASLALSQEMKDIINALIENNELIEKRENPWKGKNWLAYGDSITAISNGDSTQNGWAK